jgi:hypothetical protein
MEELCTYLKLEQEYVSFDNLCGWQIREKILTLLKSDGGSFLEDKRSNQVEIILQIKILSL